MIGEREKKELSTKKTKIMKRGFSQEGKPQRQQRAGGPQRKEPFEIKQETNWEHKSKGQEKRHG